MKFNENLILDTTLTHKNDVFDLITDNLIANGFAINKEEVVERLKEREAQVSTGFEEGIAIPHAKITGINEPIITIIRAKAIDWPSFDQKPTDFIINILVPEDQGGEHLRILASLTRKLVNKEFIEQIKGASNSELIEIINEIEATDKPQTIDNKMEIKGSFVAITSCPMGVAHTYMAAESLENYAKNENYQAKVETQGSVGTENELTNAEIEQADFVIIAADRQVDLERFYGKKIIEVSTKTAINDVEGIFKKVDSAPICQAGSQPNKQEKEGNEIMKALMNGVSYMLPLVVIGGLFLGLSLAFGGQATADGLVIPEDSFWYTVQNVGLVGFTLMIPILAGYIAHALGGRPALAPGLIIGWIANNGSFYNSEAGAGFLGAIIGGLLVGYFVRYFARIKLPKNLQAIMPILIIPLVTTFVTSIIFIFVIGKPIAVFFLALSNFLASLPTEQMVIIGAILGAMIAVDMGGPINKTAMLFAIGMIANGQPEFMGINGVAVATPSIGVGLATMLRPKYYSDDEKSAGLASLIMGTVGITEGAIPFAAAYPKEMFPANIIGAMVGGMIAAFFGITNVVPHGGIVIAFTGGINSPLIFVIAIIIGAFVTALIANMLMRRRFHNEK